MLQTYSIDGTGRQIDTKARFFRYESGNAAGADVAIRVNADGNDLGTYMPGDAIKLPIDATRWTITPASSALVAVVRLGVASVESARLVGTVSVVDEGATKSRAGDQFAGASSSGAAAVIRVQTVRAEGVELAIKRIAVASEVAGEVQFFTASGNPIPATTTFGWPNKLGVAAQPTGVKNDRFSLASAQYVTSGVDYPTALAFATIVIPANTLIELPMTTPFVLRAGESLGVNATVINRGIKFWIDGEVL